MVVNKRIIMMFLLASIIYIYIYNDKYVKMDPILKKIQQRVDRN